MSRSRHGGIRPDPADSGTAGWAELHVHSAFSFFHGCAQPRELVEEAARLGISVLAVTDGTASRAARQWSLPQALV
ncbi:PHP domain-containing protein [Streptomyces cyaneofuscatus]|uniref:PHP domain-containing protein n=1 Tax=Streptomyces cyaneofuscatus TaxID=66883 RepID=UPI00342E1367